MDFYLTFGPKHHDWDGGSLGDRYAVVSARNGSEARVIVALLRGRKWAYLYDSPDDAGVEEFGLSRVSLQWIYLPEKEAPRGFESLLFVGGEQGERTRLRKQVKAGDALLLETANGRIAVKSESGKADLTIEAPRSVEIT